MRASLLASLVTLGWCAAQLCGCSAGAEKGGSHTSSGGSGGSLALGGSGGGIVSSGGSVSLGGDLNMSEGGSDMQHTKRCDDQGNCSCIAVASIGHEGVWGPCSSDTTTAFQTWLNTQSTAKVDTYDMTKPELTPEFLAKYDVLVLQWMVETGKQNMDGAPWSFSDAEVSALKDWVNNGGGLIALSGYQCEDPSCIQDITASNKLLSFTDIQFNRDVQLNPKNQANQNNYYCWGSAMPLGAAMIGGTSPTITLGSWDQASPIGKNVKAVGAFDARSITSATATVDCSDGMTKYAVHQEVGKGHVVAYGDEWITYTGEWTGGATCLPTAGFMNMSDPCYQKSPAQVFQISQLWYNAIKYAASSVECFDIRNPEIVK